MCVIIMITNIFNLYDSLNQLDFRILLCIEINMKHREWVPLYEIEKYTKYSITKLIYRLSWLYEKKIILKTLNPYEGYKLCFNSYNLLSLNTYLKRGTFQKIISVIGVGKESTVLKIQKDNNLFALKIHKEGETSFKHVKRVREHLNNKHHFSWIYASRLSAEREYDIMKKLYSIIKLPKPIDQNRHTLIMELIDGTLLYKTTLLNPIYYLELIIFEIKKLYNNGIIHGDLSEYNILILESEIQIIDWSQYITVENIQ